MSPLVTEFVQTACIWEACARKVGNVHRYRDFEKTTLNDFLLSAVAIREAFSTEQSVGKMILEAVTTTQNVVGQNTNLGIILVLAPLACCRPHLSIQVDIRRVLNELSVDDCRKVYQAIRLAKPGGLGNAHNQDVADEPTTTLLEAMVLAADRDQIARQYASGFQDVLQFGLPVFEIAFSRWQSIEAAIIELQLQWMAREPDTLITRKCGLFVAQDVQRRALQVQELGGIKTAQGRVAGRVFDTYLRSDGNRLNPGTTADLIAAVLFIALRERIVTTRDQFNWLDEDWL